MGNSSIPWIVGGLALGAGFVWWRGRKAAAVVVEKKTDGCAIVGAAAELAQAGSGALAEAACRVTGGALGAAQGFLEDHLLGKVTAADIAKWDAKNKTLNGAVELPLDDVKRVSALDLMGSVLKFENGCVPFLNAHGWEKCAAGTEDMVHDDRGGHLEQTRTGGVHSLMGGIPSHGLFQDDWAAGEDPATGGPYDVADYFTHARSPDPHTSVPNKPPPIPVPAGHSLYLNKGRWFTCGAGLEPAWDTNDHRTGSTGIPACTPNGKSAFDNPKAGKGPSASTLMADGNSSLRFVVDHWEQFRNGKWVRV